MPSSLPNTPTDAQTLLEQVPQEVKDIAEQSLRGARPRHAEAVLHARREAHASRLAR